MIYKFRSKATGDVIMLGPNGDQLLRILGREPAPKGIVEPASMADAIARLQAAVEADEAARAKAAADDGADAGPDDRAPADAVPLRPRVWPMVEMFKRAQAAGEPVVWGV